LAQPLLLRLPLAGVKPNLKEKVVSMLFLCYKEDKKESEYTRGKEKFYDTTTFEKY